jgi:hypothetical protein
MWRDLATYPECSSNNLNAAQVDKGHGTYPPGIALGMLSGPFH